MVGYSVKARGIARDLFGTEDSYVLPIQDMYRPQQLTEAFRLLYNQNEQIHSYLSKKMNEYRQGGSAIQAIKEL